jgi:hypothetical protein
LYKQRDKLKAEADLSTLNRPATYNAAALFLSYLLRERQQPNFAITLSLLLSGWW